MGACMSKTLIFCKDDVYALSSENNTTETNENAIEESFKAKMLHLPATSTRSHSMASKQSSVLTTTTLEVNSHGDHPCVQKRSSNSSSSPNAAQLLFSSGVANRAGSFRASGKRSRHTRDTRSTMLREDERERVKRCWPTVVKKAQSECNNQSIGRTMIVGLSVMKRLIELEPKLGKVLQIPTASPGGGLHLDMLPDDHIFVQHVRIINSFLELMLRNLDELEAQVGPALVMYGRKHCHHRASGYAPEHLNILTNAILQLIADSLQPQSDCDEQQSQSVYDEDLELTMQAWSSILRFVSRKFGEGYEFEVLHGSHSHHNVLTQHNSSPNRMI